MLAIVIWCNEQILATDPSARLLRLFSILHTSCPAPPPISPNWAPSPMWPLCPLPFPCPLYYIFFYPSRIMSYFLIANIDSHNSKSILIFCSLLRWFFLLLFCGRLSDSNIRKLFFCGDWVLNQSHNLGVKRPRCPNKKTWRRSSEIADRRKLEGRRVFSKGKVGEWVQWW